MLHKPMEFLKVEDYKIKYFIVTQNIYLLGWMIPNSYAVFYNKYLVFVNPTFIIKHNN